MEYKPTGVLEDGTEYTDILDACQQLIDSYEEGTTKTKEGGLNEINPR